MTILSLIIACPLSLGNIYPNFSFEYEYSTDNATSNLHSLMSNDENIMNETPKRIAFLCLS